MLTGEQELHNSSGTPKDTKTLKQRLFHTPENIDEMSLSSLKALSAMFTE